MPRQKPKKPFKIVHVKLDSPYVSQAVKAKAKEKMAKQEFKRRMKQEYKDTKHTTKKAVSLPSKQEVDEIDVSVEK